MERGMEKARKITTKAMLKNKFSVDDICEITNLVRKEVEQLKRELENKKF